MSIHLARGLRNGVRVLTALLCLSACGADEPLTHVQVNLLELFPYTETGQAVPTIDFGTPTGDARLQGGWVSANTERLDGPIVWAGARRSSVGFVLHATAPRRLVVRSGLFSPEHRGFQKVIVRLNDRRVGILRLQQGWQESVVVLPARAQRPGRNELTFVHPGLSRRDRAKRRHRELPRVAYDWIRLEGSDGTSEQLPSLSSDGSAIVIPADTRADFYLRPSLPAELAFDVQPAAGASPALRVTVESDGAAERDLFSGRVPSGPLDLSRHARQPIRLSFIAEGVEGAKGDGDVHVVAPRILGVEQARQRHSGGPLERSGRNVLLYVIDTLRADHLGCYGYSRPTSPSIDALAAEGILFRRTVAQSSWTRPAVASILTGLGPYAHGTLTLRDPLPARMVTLAERLQAEGHRTAAVVTNVNVAGRLGFAQGFSHFEYLNEDARRPGVHVSADAVNARVFEWLAENRDDPFFLYVHVSDPHAPYRPPASVLERLPTSALPPGFPDREVLRVLRTNADLVTAASLAHLVSRYDAEIAFVDESFGRLVAELRRLGVLESTLLVLTSDHGEEFYERGGFEHGRTLYEEQITVPLIMRLPGGQHAGRRPSLVARHVDIVPTVLEQLGIAPPDGLEGRSLVPWIRGDDRAAPAAAVAQTSLGRPVVEAVVVGRWKVLRTQGIGRERVEAYDLEDDPREQVNRADERPILVGYARQVLGVSGARPPAGPGEFRLDPVVAERLRLLGYVLDGPEDRTIDAADAARSGRDAHEP